jgi:PA domain/Secretion system C-terminal sorting domain
MIMLKNVYLLLLGGFFLLWGTLALAQPDGTQGDQFLVRIISTSGTRDVQRGSCGFEDSSFGPDLDKAFSAEAVWAYDSEGNDSLVCDPITRSYAGKIVMIRRGDCFFSDKVYRAQQAGAIAVLIANHAEDPTHTGCTVFPMGAGDNPERVTIPSILVCRDVANDLDRRIKAGEKPVVSFILPRFYNGYGATSYATPLSQNDTLETVGVRYVNRTTAVQNNVIVKLDVIAPDRTMQTFTRTLPAVRVGVDTFVRMPLFKLKDLKGVHQMIFSNSAYRESRDTVRRSFRLTDYTFATDDYVIDPFGLGITSNSEFVEGGLRIQWASLYITGDRPAVPVYITFGLSNVDSVFVRDDPEANDVAIMLYDADANNDGQIDLTTNFDGIMRNIVASAIYRMTGRELVDTLFSVRLTPRTGTRLELKRNHPYYLSYMYDGVRAGHGRCLRFTNGVEGPYLNFPTLPYHFGELFDEPGNNLVVMQRLELEGFRPTVSAEPEPPLDASKYKILPNPAVDYLRLNLTLDKAQSATVQLIDLQGRIVSTEVVRNFQDGQIILNVRNLPSGGYTLWMRTEKEGTAMEQVMVCH